MFLHFFAILALKPEPAQDELNRFCAAERGVAEIKRALGVHSATG